MLTKVLSQNGFIMLNKELSRKLGLESAVLLGFLYSMYEYWENRDMLDDDGSFFCTREDIEENTTLNPYAQRKALKILKENGVIDMKLKGVPAKTYYYINDEKVMELLGITTQQVVKSENDKMFKNYTSRDLEIKQQDAKNLNNINNNIYNKKDKKERINKNIADVKDSSKILTTSKNFKKLKHILKIIDEYAFNENIIELLEKFFNGLLENKILLTDDKVRANLSRLVNLDESTIIEAIKLSIDNGYKNINPEWLKNKNKSQTSSQLYWEHDNSFDREEYKKKLKDLEKNGEAFHF